MATTIMLIMLVLLAITIIPWLVGSGHEQMHRTDLMAGDEGED